MIKLSPNFTLDEAVVTSLARKIDNSVPVGSPMYGVLIQTARNMEEIRYILDNKRIHVTSWYRCPELNAAVGGVTNSAHTRGYAVDFICPEYGDPYSCCVAIVNAMRDPLIAWCPQIDQIIYEYSWVHIAFKEPDKEARKMVLTGNSSGYKEGLFR